MMRFAWVTMLIAALGGVWLALPVSPPTMGDQAEIGGGLKLWRLPKVSELAVEPQVEASAAELDVQELCAKIGLFPRQEWAERAHIALWMDESVVRHTVLTAKMNYYLVYPGLTREGLEAQLEKRRPQTDGLISKRVHAESC